GLRAAERIEFGVLASLRHETDFVVWQLAACSATLGEALEKLARYFSVGFGGSRLEVERDGEAATIRLHIDAEPAPRALVDFIVGMIVCALRVLPTPGVRATLVSLPHDGAA